LLVLLIAHQLFNALRFGHFRLLLQTNHFFMLQPLLLKLLSFLCVYCSQLLLGLLTRSHPLLLFLQVSLMGVSDFHVLLGLHHLFVLILLCVTLSNGYNFLGLLLSLLNLLPSLSESLKC